MTPSPFPGCEDFEDFERFDELLDEEGLGLFDYASPQEIQILTQAQQQQQQQQQKQPLTAPHNHMLSLDHHPQPLSQPFTNMQSVIADPDQFHIQPQIPSQASFHNINVHHEQLTPQSDLKHHIAQVKARIDVLQSQVDEEELQKQLQKRGQQPYLQVQTKLQPEQPKVQKQRRGLKALSTDQNPPKQRRVIKKSTGNSNAPLTLGLASNANNSYAMGIARSDPQVKCPSCDISLADSHAVRRHFRMIHASTDITDMTSNICQECLLPCSSATKFRDHWKSAHVGELKFICNLCGARFSKKRNLSLHGTKVHKLPTRPKPKSKRPRPKLPKCKLCGFTSPEKQNIAIHFFAEHCDEVGLECHGCGRTFESKVDAGAHYFKCTHKALADE